MSSVSLEKLALRGATWTIFGYGTNQVLRLGSNLILTRLLFPEVFGLMALVQVCIAGLQMFSDIGIVPSIVQNKRGDEPEFYNTAWTIQVIRGLIIWIVTLLLAKPAALFYGEPMLEQLLPVVGINSVIGGFNSTKLATANRKLSLGKLTLIELGSYISSLIVMIAWAWVNRSVWSLVVGGIVGTMVKMILSHIALEGEHNRFHWEQRAFMELQRFGRWIFLSTILTFIAGQGDRLILGRLTDVNFLGIYAIGTMMSRIVFNLAGQLGNRVLFPSYSTLVRENSERLYPVLRKCRLLIIAMSWSFSLFFIIFGQQLINFLYDDRYVQAGWILQTLSLGHLVGILGFTYSNVLFAKGKTLAISALLALQITTQIAGMFLGAYWGGQEGLIIGLACADWINYSAMALCVARLSLWQMEVDLPIITLAFGVVVLTIFT